MGLLALAGDVRAWITETLLCVPWSPLDDSFSCSPGICLLRHEEGGKQGANYICPHQEKQDISQKLCISYELFLAVWNRNRSDGGFSLTETPTSPVEKSRSQQHKSKSTCHHQPSFLPSLLCRPRHVVAILTAALWSKKAAGAPAFWAGFAHFICVLQVGQGALFVVITQRSTLLEQLPFLVAEGKSSCLVIKQPILEGVHRSPLVRTRCMAPPSQ